ncbi:hypothetical protein ACXZ7E_05425 [Paenibacillus lautus]
MKKLKAIVTSATVVSKQGWSNMAMVEFTLQGEKSTYGINFYNYGLGGQSDRLGIMYMFPSLYKYAEAPHDSEDISNQVLNILSEKGESLRDTVGPWGQVI